MKGKNSPRKVNARRITVAKRLSSILETGKNSKGVELTPAEIDRIKEQYESLVRKILPLDTARARRTKKYRGVELH